MCFLEILCYTGSALFVAVYLALLVLISSSDKARRALGVDVGSLWLHKLRAMLAVLGIIVGPAAVIALMFFGERTMQDSLEDIKRQGVTNIIVRSVEPPDEINTQTRSSVAHYGITQDDYEMFKSIPTIIRMVPMRIFPKPVHHDQHTFNSRIVATTPEYKEINGLQEAAGRFLVDKDSNEKDNICVLGSNVAANLFPRESPIDQTILIDNFNYLVVGVTEERKSTGGTSGSQTAEDFNNDVYIPIGTTEGRFGKKVFLRPSGTRSGEHVEFSQITMTVCDIDEVRPAAEAIKTILDRHHRPDIVLTVPLDMLDQAVRERKGEVRLTILMAAIGGISLVVGGIGIMDIMHIWKSTRASTKS